ncbi:MAG: hypothetical protein KAS07_00815 [Candidatus Pacebacteria bacterium]|nr:hypothetical protein [Candidatus Paceibacterota bacterium]
MNIYSFLSTYGYVILNINMQETGITILNEVSKPAFFITPTMLWLVFAVVFVLFAVISAVIIYHWYTYGYAPKAVSRVLKVYFFGSGCIVISAIASIILYTTSL